MKIIYADDKEHPELIEMCASCTQPDCSGLCTAYRQKYRELHGLPKLNTQQRRDKSNLRNDNKHDPYEAFGEIHTLAEWSRKTGIYYGTIWKRLLYGWSIEDALSKPAKTRNIVDRAERYEAFGQSLTIREWSERCGVNVRTLYRRLDNGWPIEKALTEAPVRYGHGK